MTGEIVFSYKFIFNGDNCGCSLGMILVLVNSVAVRMNRKYYLKLVICMCNVSSLVSRNAVLVFLKYRTHQS